MEAATVRVRAVAPAVPVAMLYSDTDPITDTAAAASWAKSFGVATREFPGMLHELFNEIGKEDVLKATGDWLADGKL